MDVRPLRSLFLGALIALAPAARAWQAASASPAATEAAVIEAKVQEWLAKPEAVALSVAVARGDELVFSRAFGMADLEFQVPANEDTLFRIGSVTKQFTAAAILRLAEKNALDVDAEATEYLPELHVQGHAVTLRNLLTHTSGFKSYTELESFWKEAGRELSLEEMLALFQDEPFEFEPGTKFKYCNSGYYLLGKILERVTDVEYGEYLRREFFEPLGLQSTRHDSNELVLQNRAQGYRFENGEFRNDPPIGLASPGAAGALVSSAKDLVRWQRALATGKVVSAASYEEMTTPFMFEDGRETGYGMGLMLGEFAGQRAVVHDGGIFGFNSSLAYYPESELSVAVISNCEALPASGVAQAIARMLLAE